MTVYRCSKEKWKQLLENGNHVFMEAIAKQKMAGVCAGVYQDGQERVKWILGAADREQGRPMQENTLFRIFSMTKPLISVAIFQLWERGRLDLEDELWWYYPEFKHKQVAYGGTLVPADRPLQLRDLLNMTAGIPYPGIGNAAQQCMSVLYDEMNRRQRTAHPVSTQELCRRIGAEIPLEFQPGTQWEYGASADVLGALVELVADMPLDEYLRQNILEPLGMTDTDFYVPPEKWERFAQLYQWDGSSKQLRIEPDPHLGMTDYRKKPTFLSGGAGLISTLSDYAAFSQMLACGGMHPERGVRLLGQETCRFLQTPQLTGQQQHTLRWDSLRGHSYGNLFRVLTDPAAFSTNAPAGEFGWDGWTGPYFTVSPQYRMSLVYLIQNCGAGMNDVLRKLRAMVYGAIGNES